MSHSPILSQFIQLLGEDKVATGDRRTEHYRSGWRSGSGTALAVLFPDSLLSLWQALQICVDNNCIIIMQAAKTGWMTGKHHWKSKASMTPMAAASVGEARPA